MYSHETVLLFGISVTVNFSRQEITNMFFPCVIYKAETQKPKNRESPGNKSHFNAIIS